MGSRHGYSDRSERVQNPHGAAVGFQYPIKSLVAVRRFIDASSTKLYASLGHFRVHHLARDLRCALHFAGLPIDVTSCFATRQRQRALQKYISPCSSASTYPYGGTSAISKEQTRRLLAAHIMSLSQSSSELSR